MDLASSAVGRAPGTPRPGIGPCTWHVPCHRRTAGRGRRRAARTHPRTLRGSPGAQGSRSSNPSRSPAVCRALCRLSLASQAVALVEVATLLGRVKAEAAVVAATVEEAAAEAMVDTRVDCPAVAARAQHPGTRRKREHTAALFGADCKGLRIPSSGKTRPLDAYRSRALAASPAAMAGVMMALEAQAPSVGWHQTTQGRPLPPGPWTRP